MEKERRNFIRLVPNINKKKIQFKYIALIVLAQLVCVSILAFGFNFSARIILNNVPLGRYAEMHLDKVFYWMNWFILFITLISVFIGGLFSLHISHRFIGPLCRIENTLRTAITEGKLPELSVRKDDELQDLIGLLKKISG